MKDRSRAEIITAILQCTTVEIKKSKLMCDAFLSLLQARRYISYLEQNKMIQYNEKTLCYSITEIGREFLHLRQQIDDLFACKEHARIYNEILLS